MQMLISLQSRPAIGNSREPSESYSGVGDEGSNAGPTKRDCRKRHAARHCGGTAKGRKHKKIEKLRKLTFCLKKNNKKFTKCFIFHRLVKCLFIIVVETIFSKV